MPNSKSAMTKRLRLDFASDNTAGICPEALAALTEANAGNVPSYGDDPASAEARAHLSTLFETECDIYFVFNGTAANSLALSALCQRHHSILCHEYAHVATDECGAPEFFTGGAKVIPVPGADAKLHELDLAPVLTRGHGVHAPKPRAVSITQATELGTVYTPDEIRALADFAHGHGLALHMDGARFANAVASPANEGATPADLTWHAGVDVLCFGGTKNGLLGSEAVIFFNRDAAREFEYRVKQSGQLASKARFAAAQWNSVLRGDAWRRHAAHANAQARKLAAGCTQAGLTLIAPTEANGVFVTLAPAIAAALADRGWQFYKFVGEQGYRFMCSWNTSDGVLAEIVSDLHAVAGARA